MRIENDEAWASAKKRLGFGKATQDDDMEGSIILDRLPSKAEAVQIRDILGIPKRVEYSEEVLAAKREQFSMARQIKPLLPASAAEEAPEATLAPQGYLGSATPLAAVRGR